MHYVPMSLGDVRSDHSLPALLLSIIFLALIPLGPFFARCLNALKPGFLTVNFEVDEDLPNYFSALDENDRRFMIAEEENMREKYVRTYA